MTVVVSNFFIVNVLAIRISGKIKVNKINVDRVEAREAYY
tara:strand:+ start:2350 stop:2469 length:120 start_codon:yes stop_codon:yes gene_type:complete